MITTAQFFIGAVPGFLTGIAVGAVAMVLIIRYALEEQRQIRQSAYQKEVRRAREA